MRFAWMVLRALTILSLTSLWVLDPFLFSCDSYPQKFCPEGKVSSLPGDPHIYSLCPAVTSEVPPCHSLAGQRFTLAPVRLIGHFLLFFGNAWDAVAAPPHPSSLAHHLYCTSATSFWGRPHWLDWGYPFQFFAQPPTCVRVYLSLY